MFNLNEGLLKYYYPDVTFDLNYPVPIMLASIVTICLVGYMLGSLNSAVIVSRLVYRDDVRKHGSGNAGMTNMLRTFGGKAAGLTLLGDLLKTVISVFFAGILFGFQYVGGVSISGFCYLAGVMAVLGHIFPVYYGFKGGKGVLVTSTMALMLSPVIFGVLFIAFVVIVALSRYVSLGSVVVAMLYPILLRGYFSMVFNVPYMPIFVTLSSITLPIIIVLCHIENLKRIGNRTENKLSFGKKGDKSEDK